MPLLGLDDFQGVLCSNWRILARKGRLIVGGFILKFAQLFTYSLLANVTTPFGIEIDADVVFLSDKIYTSLHTKSILIFKCFNVVSA